MLCFPASPAAVVLHAGSEIPQIADFFTKQTSGSNVWTAAMHCKEAAFIGISSGSLRLPLTPLQPNATW